MVPAEENKSLLDTRMERRGEPLHEGEDRKDRKYVIQMNTVGNMVRHALRELDAAATPVEQDLRDQKAAIKALLVQAVSKLEE